MSPVMLDQYEDIKERARKTPRVTYTELARGRAWRDQLPECGIIEVSDRNEASAWLVSDEHLKGMLTLIDELLAEREEAQIREMISARANYQNWLEGEELGREAAKSFLARKEAMRAAINGD